MKTYEGKTLREIKALHPNCKAVYKRFCGLGDHGIEIGGKFYCDDYPMMDRRNKAKARNFTGVVANIDFSCEVFVNGESHGTTSKHRASVYLRMLRKGIDIDSSYLSSTRSIRDFMPEASEKAKRKTEINNFVHAICDDSGKAAHDYRNIVRAYAYKFGLEAVKEKYLS